MRTRRGQRRLKLDLSVVGLLATGATVPGIGIESNQQAEVRGWRFVLKCHDIVYAETCHDIVYKPHNSTHIAMVINDQVQPLFHCCGRSPFFH